MDDDATTVIKMLQALKSETCRRNSGVSLRLSNAGLSMSNLGPAPEDKSSNPRESKSPENNSSPLKRRRLDSTHSSTFNLSSTSDSTPGTPWEWRRLKGELVALRTRLSHTEATVNQLHKIRREIEEVFERDKHMLEMQAELDKQTIKQLELRVESSRKSTHDAREAQASAESELFQTKSKLEAKILALMTENARLKEINVIYSNSEEFSSSPKPQEDNSEIQAKLEAADDRILELEGRVKELVSTQQELELQNLELQNVRMKVETLEAERALWEEGRSLLARAARANELEKELQLAREQINNLREAVKGKLLLEEQICNMEKRLEHTERVEAKLGKMEVKCEELTSRVQEYETIGIGRNPTDLKKEVHRLQQAEVILMLEEGKLRSQVDALQRENDGLQRKYDETKKMATDMTNSTEKLNKFIIRLQKKMLLVSRERDSYRQQLDLYEKEMTTLEGNNAVTERIPALERAVEGYRDLVEKLEADLATVSDPATLRAKDECRQLREEVERLKGELEHRALKGDFNVNSRILHFKMNPAAIAEQQAEEKQKALLQEVEELRARVQHGFTAQGGAPLTTSSSFQAQELAELKQSHEIKIARLKEAFKASSQEYRQACYQLFGWRVDRTKERRYKLSSQYAESPDDFLFFHVDEGVDLLETEFSSTLGPLIDRHLIMQHSVPMFLNAVQMELFSQQTITNIVG
ncbi:mitotic spindle assembly checkpoint protein MAD1 [Fopius arisanus]|uniref:Mitotic spindle assembly checkpoint protein MAD1 n=1 Tax=Fopius arisanus TaxID=64838 RepID=A0A9R1TVF7_9HYME|nr:PREDICTED: mitotic spindle assembly checkpoint protein MAD1 [Fopius arisanus]